MRMPTKKLDYKPKTLYELIQMLLAQGRIKSASIKPQITPPTQADNHRYLPKREPVKKTKVLHTD